MPAVFGGLPMPVRGAFSRGDFLETSPNDIKFASELLFTYEIAYTRRIFRFSYSVAMGKFPFFLSDGIRL